MDSVSAFSKEENYYSTIVSDRIDNTIAISTNNYADRYYDY